MPKSSPGPGNLPFTLTLRYLSGRNSNLGTVGNLAFWGLVISVVVLVVVLSVVNGFERELRLRVLNLLPQLTVDFNTELPAKEMWQSIEGLKGIAPKVSGNVLLVNKRQIRGASVTGIDQQYADVSDILSYIERSEALWAERYGIVLGSGLADSLDVGVGDSVRLIVPIGSAGVAGMIPRQRSLLVTGILQSDSLLDAQTALINLDLAQRLFRLRQPQGYHARLQDLFDVSTPSRQIYSQFADGVRISSWYERYGNLYQAIAVQKLTMFILLLFLVGVAAFNLVSGLIMIIEQRRSDVAILRTMGFRSRDVMLQFLTLGTALSAAGITLGLLLGTLLSLLLPAAFTWLDSLGEGALMSQYFIGYLPVEVLLDDLLTIAGIALVLAFIATIFPAWRATQLLPSEVLNHE